VRVGTSAILARLFRDEALYPHPALFLGGIGKLILFLIALVFVPAVASATVEISFPLDGYYRPGKYFPVRIATRGEPTGMLWIGAAGAVATEMPISGRDQTVILPMLAITSSLRDLHVGPPSGHAPARVPNLIALTDEDRLVAMVGDESIAAQMLFSGKNILPVQLDTSRPLFEPLAAWQSLDGVVLDPATAGHVSQRQLAGLLAAGTVVAIDGGNRPSGPWHWKQIGSLWVASRPEAGPDEVMQPDAYSPSWGWQTHFDAGLRWRVFVAAAIFSAALIALLLLRPRGMTLIAVAVAGLATGGAIFWHSRQVTAQSLHGSVFIRGGLAVLHDEWSYHAVLRPETVTEPFEHLLRPVFGYDRQPADTQMRLQCDDRGNPIQFIYRQQPRTTLAFVARSIEPGIGNLSPVQPIRSPLLPMAEELYLGPSDRLAGMVAAPPGDNWPAVVINAPSRSFESE
jgi:hypothetical protein